MGLGVIMIESTFSSPIASPIKSSSDEGDCLLEFPSDGSSTSSIRLKLLSHVVPKFRLTSTESNFLGCCSHAPCCFAVWVIVVTHKRAHASSIGTNNFQRFLVDEIDEMPETLGQSPENVNTACSDFCVSNKSQPPLVGMER